MQKDRHPVFQQMAMALSHQQNGNAELALAYWENVLHILPSEVRIHNEILAEYTQLVEQTTEERFQRKVQSLTQTYQQDLNEDEQVTFQAVYRAMSQQCSDQFSLAFAYWKHALETLTTNSLVITLGVEDLCWNAHEYIHKGHLKESIDVYGQILKTFPEFLEGYINLSIIQLKANRIEDALRVLTRIPERYKQEFILTRYVELYQKMLEVAEQFGHVPYASIERIVEDLQLENTFYPSIAERDFNECIEEVVNREKRFFDQRRKAMEEKAIAKSSKRIAEEGLPLGERVVRARQAKSDDIPKFLYDNEIRIVEVLLDNANISLEDVLVMAQTSPVSEILAYIANHYKWGTFHNITMAVALNPQTLPAVSIRLLKRLSIHDLATIFYKKNIPTEVRIRAKQQIQEVFNNLSLYDKVATIEGSLGDILKLLDAVNVEIPDFLEKLIEKFPVHPDIIVNICRWKLTPASILSHIGADPRFTASMQVKFALLSNPRTPMGVVIALLQSMKKSDLRDLLLNKHLPSGVKQSISALFPES